MSKIVMLIQCGGMRNAFTQGVLGVIGDLLRPRVHTVYAASSGVETALFFLSRQTAEARDVWVNQLTRPQVCGLTNLLRSGRLANVHHLVDTCCHRLDLCTVLHSPVKIKVGVVCAQRAKTQFVLLRRHNQRLLRKATCALPLFAAPIPLEDQLYIDGGTLDPLPIETVCREEQTSRIVIFANRPAGLVEQHRAIERYLAFPTNSELRRGFAERSQRLERSWEFIQQSEHSRRIFVVAPPESVPASRLCRNPRIMEATWEMGEAYGQDVRQRLSEFLSA